MSSLHVTGQLETRSNITIASAALGVVLVDDLHKNDYSTTDLSTLKKDLSDLGYITYFFSELGSWENMLQYADFVFLSAPYTSFTTAEYSAMNAWFANGSRNLIIASRGDFNDVQFSAVNTLLSNLGATLKIQNDNVYTTDSSVPNKWYIHTDNLNTSYPQFFSGVSNLNFFSPSSVTFASNAVPLVYAEAEAYQTDQNNVPPSKVYDDTSDGVGGDVIPLVATENVSNGAEMDRIVVTGSVLWSDFDYSKTEYDNILFMHNILSYMYNQTIATVGTFDVYAPDFIPPKVDITYPYIGMHAKGMINITTDVSDAINVKNVSIQINGIERATSTYYLWNTTAEINGPYNITVIAYDDEENLGWDSVVVTVNQDYTPVLSHQIKYMTYNIKESGINPQWMDVVKEENPDIVTLVETGTWDDNSNILQEQYRSILNQYFIDEIPYSAYTDQNTEFSTMGITILSRFPILQIEEINSIKLDDGKSINPTHDFLHAVVAMQNNSVHIISGHLKCCDGSTNIATREKEQEGINNFFDSLGDVAIIYAGDLNSFSPQDTGTLAPKSTGLGTEPVAMLIDPTNPHAPKHHIFLDVFRTLYPDIPGYTYGGSSRIDYIFVNQWLATKVMNTTTGDTESALAGSDHVSVDVFLDFSSGLSPSVPSAPQNLEITASSTSNVLTWQPPIVTFNASVTSYKIYAADSENAIGELIDTVKGMSFTLSSNLVGKYIRITAITVYGEGAQSEAILYTGNTVTDLTSKKTFVSPIYLLTIVTIPMIRKKLTK